MDRERPRQAHRRPASGQPVLQQQGRDEEQRDLRPRLRRQARGHRQVAQDQHPGEPPSGLLLGRLRGQEPEGPRRYRPLLRPYPAGVLHQHAHQRRYREGPSDQDEGSRGPEPDDGRRPPRDRPLGDPRHPERHRPGQVSDQHHPGDGPRPERSRRRGLQLQDAAGVEELPRRRLHLPVLLPADHQRRVHLQQDHQRRDAHQLQHPRG